MKAHRRNLMSINLINDLWFDLDMRKPLLDDGLYRPARRDTWKALSTRYHHSHGPELVSIHMVKLI